MATEKTPLKIYRGTNGTNSSSGTVPALQAGTLIFNEGLGFLTLDVNTSKATVSDAAKALLKDTVDFMTESIGNTDTFKIMTSNDNSNVMRLPLLASGAFYATYADRATQAGIANYTQLDNDAEKSWKHSISDSFLHSNDEYIISNNQIKRQIIKTDNSIETENVTSTDDIFTNYVATKSQSTLQPLNFYNTVTISSQYGLTVDPTTSKTYMNVGLLNPSLYLERYATLQTEDNIVLKAKSEKYEQTIQLWGQFSQNANAMNTVYITNNSSSIFKHGVTTSSEYTPVNDYDLVTVAYMQENAGGKAIFRRWS